MHTNTRCRFWCMLCWRESFRSLCVPKTTNTIKWNFHLGFFLTSAVHLCVPHKCVYMEHSFYLNIGVNQKTGYRINVNNSPIFVNNGRNEWNIFIGTHGCTALVKKNQMEHPFHCVCCCWHTKRAKKFASSEIQQ